MSYELCLSTSAQLLASEQVLPQATVSFLARLASMVTPARAHTLSVATRTTAEEAASADAQLAALGTDVWAREQRQRLEEAYAGVEEAEQALHEFVTSLLDQLEEVHGTAPAVLSQQVAGQTHVVPWGSSELEPLVPARSATRWLSQAPMSALPASPLPARAPVEVHDLPPGTCLFASATSVEVSRVEEHPVVVVPQSTARSSTQPIPYGHCLPPPPLRLPPGHECARGSMLFTPVQLPYKAPPPELQRTVTTPILQGTPLPRPVAQQTVFLVPQAGRPQSARRARSRAPSTLPQGSARTPQAYGTTSATALPRDGEPYYFEIGRPWGWKIVMGDLPPATEPDEARR